MDVYVYQAALLCEECGVKTQEELRAKQRDAGKPIERDFEDMLDSHDFPQGPYSDGGGEADSPQHCDACNVFLDNPLTTDGYESVREAVRENIATGRGSVDVLREWIERYDVTLDELLRDRDRTVKS